ncbi:MAG: hypothetical protein AAFQ61_01975 [Cyanobacteria bacterium J06626_23]
MTIRPLTKSEIDTLFIQLTLAGLIPGRDFKFDEAGQIMARKEVWSVVQRIRPVPDAGDFTCGLQQPEPQQPATTAG